MGHKAQHRAGCSILPAVLLAESSGHWGDVRPFEHSFAPKTAASSGHKLGQASREKRARSASVKTAFEGKKRDV
jgi:hypothetical protein